MLGECGGNGGSSGSMLRPRRLSDSHLRGFPSKSVKVLVLTEETPAGDVELAIRIMQLPFYGIVRSFGEGLDTVPKCFGFIMFDCFENLNLLS